MKNYLLRLDNGHFIVLSSDLELKLNDKYENGTIVQVGIKMRKGNHHYDITKVYTQSINNMNDVYKHALNL
jgi:hypothetical protein